MRIMPNRWIIQFSGAGKHHSRVGNIRYNKKNARISDPIGFEPFRNDQTHNNSKNNNNNNGTIYNIIESVVSSEEGNHLSLECTKDN